MIPYPAYIPNGGTYRGKAGVREWLALTMENAEFGMLESREFIAQGDKVVVLAHAEAIIKRTSREVVQDATHVWTPHESKIARHRAYEDTAAVVAAYHPR